MANLRVPAGDILTKLLASPPDGTVVTAVALDGDDLVLAISGPGVPDCREVEAVHGTILKEEMMKWYISSVAFRPKG